MLRFKKRYLSLLFLILSSCAGGNPLEFSSPLNPARSITLNGNENTIYSGATHNLSIQVTPANHTSELSVSSSNGNISVTQLGNNQFSITGNSIGSSVITASTDNGLSANITVSSIQQPILATSININTNNETIFLGESKVFNIQVTPANHTNIVSLTSSNSNVRVNKLNSGGFSITGVNIGSSSITASTDNGLSNSMTVSTVPVVRPATSITLNSNVSSLLVGETKSLNIQVQPSNHTNILSVVSSSSSIRVNSLGTNQFSIVGSSVGSSRITVSTDNGLSANITVQVVSQELSIINHLKANGRYSSSSNSYSVSTNTFSSGNSIFGYSFAYDDDDKEFYFSAIAITESGNSSLTLFSYYTFTWNNLRGGEGDGTILLSVGSSSFLAMYDFSSINFNSPSRMSIGRYTRTYSTFSSSTSLTDSVTLMAEMLVDSYQYLYEYFVANNLETGYYI